MLTQDMFDASRVNVFSDITGDLIGDVIAIPAGFLATIYRNTTAVPFATREAAITAIENSEVLPHTTSVNQFPSNQKSLF